MRTNLSEFKICDFLLNKTRRSLFLYGNDQLSQTRFIEIISLGVENQKQFNKARLRSINIDQLVKGEFHSSSLFEDCRSDLYAVEKAGDSLVPHLDKIAEYDKKIILLAGTYALSKNLGEKLMKHPSFDCLGFFINDKKPLFSLINMIYQLFSPNYVPSNKEIQNFINALQMSDDNLRSLVLKIELNPSTFNFDTMDISETERGFVSEMEPISAIRFYISIICKKIERNAIEDCDQGINTLKKLIRLEDRIKSNSPLSKINIKTILHQWSGAGSEKSFKAS